jgi:hypothetical protein
MEIGRWTIRLLHSAFEYFCFNVQNMCRLVGPCKVSLSSHLVSQNSLILPSRDRLIAECWASEQQHRVTPAIPIESWRCYPPCTFCSDPYQNTVLLKEWALVSGWASTFAAVVLGVLYRQHFRFNPNALVRKHYTVMARIIKIDATTTCQTLHFNYLNFPWQIFWRHFLIVQS